MHQNNCIFFDSGSTLDKNSFGGKGASLREMTKLGLPVPPGFTVPTEVWQKLLEEKGDFLNEIWNQIVIALKRLEKKTGKKLGDRDNPLFLSVRSGAAISMPGILDTKINLGVNKVTTPRLEYLIGKENALRVHTSFPIGFPEDPYEQIRWAVLEVYDSWNTSKAKIYRKIHGISEIGTAITIQQMVWGNSRGNYSGAGVLLTRDTQIYSREPVIIFAPKAQGPSVVSADSPYSQIPLRDCPVSPKIRRELSRYSELLERFNNFAPQDIEFTIEGDHVWILQTRDAPLSPLANMRSLLERIEKKAITKQEAISAMPPSHLIALTKHELDPQEVVKAEKHKRLIGEGISVSIGNTTGRLVFSLEEARKAGNSDKIILFETNLESFSQVPLNVVAVLLQNAGIGSHLAREGTQLSCERNIIALFGVTINKQYNQTIVTVDGNTGKVYRGEIPHIKNGMKDRILTSREHAVAGEWLTKKRENPWRFVSAGSDISHYEKNIREVLDTIKSEHIHSLKAGEIMLFNMVIPEDIRQTYRVIKLDKKDKLIRTIKPILTGIFARGHHATIRTCHEPALPANGPWALVRNMSDFQKFLIDDHYSEKYGGFEHFMSNSQLTELLIGEIPVGKMEKDPDIQYKHSAWTLSCTENGVVVLQVHPHNAHLREHEKATKDDLITYTTCFNLRSPNHLAPIKMDIGKHLLRDKLAFILASAAKQKVLEIWWDEYELPQRLAAITHVLGINVTFEGQATDHWCLGYGIKTK